MARIKIIKLTRNTAAESSTITTTIATDGMKEEIQDHHAQEKCYHAGHFEYQTFGHCKRHSSDFNDIQTIQLENHSRLRNAGRTLCDNTDRQITLSAKVRRKSKLRLFATRGYLLLPLPPPPPRLSLRHIPLVQLLWLVCCLSSLAHNSTAECPSVCECKWKSGKESVLCLNANLTHIPAPLDAGTQVLDLTGNEIASIPDDTFVEVNLLNLQKVYLAKCRLSILERYAFRGLINLVELDLSYNVLSRIPSEALEWVTELRELKLNGNPVHIVANDAFLRMQRLVRLELSDCFISMVEVKAFAGLESSLEYLKLDGNNLSEVRSGTITSLSNLHGISLSRNQWNCSCALRPLRVWMLRENIPCGIPPICQSPPRLAGKSWDKVDLDDFACVPQIIATDTTAHGVEGRNVTMSCFVEGVPEPSVRWMVKNRIIANLTVSSGDYASTSPRTAAATQGRKTYVVNMLRNASNLTILTADMQDAGIYTCAAENKAGKVEASVTLAVSRRPPEAPLGFKIILLCVFIALLFVAGSSFAAVCLCSLRRKRKMRLWNTVPQGRCESYEKMEMTSRAGGGVGIVGSGGVSKSNLAGKLGKHDSGKNANAAGNLFHNDENGYLCTATAPLNCGSDDNGDTGGAIVNPSGGSAKRNGDYRNVPTHCDDDDNENNVNTASSSNMQHPSSVNENAYQRSLFLKETTIAAATHNINMSSTNNSSYSSNLKTGRWNKVNATLHCTTSPQDITRNKSGNPSSLVAGMSGGETTGNSSSKIMDDTDLHIPRLIDIGSANDAAPNSISGKVDANSRYGPVYNHVANWVTTSIATTKITSHNTTAYYSPKNEIDRSVFCEKDNSDNDLFDSNYPDLLDIAKYAVAQATSSTQANGGLCTLPRKLKNTGKFFKNSSDSQSPLLADNSSKYGSSDGSYMNELVLGRRFSAESSYSNYAGGTVTYTKGQRSNSFLNLVHSTSKGSATTAASNKTGVGNAGDRRNPSLPSSPVHELHQQHQRSFSSAATPLLDFTSLTTRTSLANPTTGTPSATHPSAIQHPTTTTTPVTAYDYHAAQLERFLEEYRNLQDQLCKMKETCETIRKKEQPIRVGLGHAAHAADPVMYNAALAANSPTANAKISLKSKTTLPGQPPDPPPYWLHRNAMLKRLNGSQNEIFKS
uniref:Ig-like domain-containing protein n=1 Tax=Glossina brevipalpis TaxID=37001 RepID=A0A1A9WUH3_9MUSC